MAKRRMFNPEFCESDFFLELPSSAQALFFHLSMNADDDGFCSNPKKIALMSNCTEADLKVLAAQGIIYPFESGCIAIASWNICNTLRKDRYHPTIHLAERAQLMEEFPNWYCGLEGTPPQLATVDNPMLPAAATPNETINSSKGIISPNLLAAMEEKGIAYSR